MKCAIGVVGLGVMGANLARNMESRGFAVAGYDLDAAKTTAFAAGEGRRVVGASSAAALADVLERPRKILMMVPAGKPVDDVMAHLLPHLEAGDILIDAGNSYFKDTDRREAAVAERGLLYLGTGVSGGEEVVGDQMGRDHGRDRCPIRARSSRLSAVVPAGVVCRQKPG